MTSARCWPALAMLLLACVPAFAAIQAVPAYVPADDSLILERRSVDRGTLGEVRGLRAELERNPRDPRRAAAYVRRAIALGRASGDPRWFGHAEAALAPWADIANKPTEILLLRAILAQRRHAFDEARRELDTVLDREALNAEALLIRAVLSMVQGRPAEALIDCSTLLVRSPQLAAATCVSAARSINGSAQAALDALNKLIPGFPDASEEERSWAMTVAAETAERLGQDAEAERLYRAALPLAAGRNLYPVIALADFLLRKQRGAEVETLLQPYPPVDGILLRRAQAGQGQPRSRSIIRKLEQRFSEERLRGPSSHLREEAMLALLLADPARALPLAQGNWQAQREPLDALVLAESALAARRPEAVAELRTWMQATRLEDARIAAVLARLDALAGVQP
ncbi:MAG: tetratricopeptide repeat protein [Panacagrimonas sp.]